MSDTESSPQDAPPQVNLHQTIVRLVAGAIGEGVDRLMKVASDFDAADVEPEAVLIGPINADPRLMALLGWASEFPEFVRRVSDSTARMTYPFVRATGAALDTGRHLAQITGLSQIVDAAVGPFAAAWADERERLAAVGTAEYGRGRVLAARVFEQSVDGIVGILSESEELGELVREQTLGVTGAAVQEIRQTGAAADGLTEGIFRRLLGRDHEKLPPKPAPKS